MVAAPEDPSERRPGALVERFRRARRDPSRAVLEGFHPLKHALRFGAAIEAAYTADRTALTDLAARLAPDLSGRFRAIASVPPEVLARLVPADPVGAVVAIAERPTSVPEQLLGDSPSGVIVLLENPSHMGNVGAAIRVAAAAGALAVLTTGPRDPWHPAALRGSAGLHFALPVARLDDLPPSERPLVAIDPEGAPLEPALIPERAILAFGSERRGLSGLLKARAACRLAIPMRAGVSSLNLATAVAVVLYLARLGR